MNKNKGFTLIELLVVIAIIGILSSVVLASLSNARDKGKDASVKSQLSSMKAQAELYYSTAETYKGVCSATAEMNGFQDLINETVEVSGVSPTAELNGTNGIPNTTAAGAFNYVTCHEAENTTDGTTSWAVEAPLSDSTVESPMMYCVDSTGVSKVITNNPLSEGETVCNDVE